MSSETSDRLLAIERHLGIIKEEPVFFVITPDKKWELSFFIPHGEAEKHYAEMNNLFDAKGRALLAKCKEIKL